MLTGILLRYFVRCALVLIGAVVAGTWVALGGPAAVGAVAGGSLMLLSGFSLVYGVGKLLDPTVANTTKTGLVLLLLVKLTFVAGLLWVFLSVFGLDGLGLLLGMGAGLVGLVIGLNLGSTSAEGLRAMEEAQARIAEEMEDSEDRSR